MKLDKDKFEFEVQDITLKNTSPVYKFTETGVTRNGKTYRAAGITCSIINAHNQDVYRKIHSNYDPINKDDDNFGRFDEDWRKWEILRKRLINHEITSGFQRFITLFSHFNTIPSTVPTKTVGQELQEIADALLAADSRLTDVYIGGDWTNGNWVNSTMYNYYNANINNTNDDVVLFIKLRKKLHNEDRISKYMIHINNNVSININQLAGVISLYSKKAEFYFQKPVEGNFIKIP